LKYKNVTVEFQGTKKLYDLCREQILYEFDKEEGCYENSEEIDSINK